MGQQGAWIHYNDMKFISNIMLLFHDCYDESMGRKQNLLLLWLHLGEYGQNFSHTYHDLSGERGGTSKVQRGYLSKMEEEENILSHTSMMVDGFGMWNAKGKSHGETRGLSLRPTTLSLCLLYTSDAADE